MVKATEKELLRLLQQINELRVFANKPPFLLGKKTIIRKMQKRNLFQIKTICVHSGNGHIFERTPFLSGQTIQNFLEGILDGIKIGIKIAPIKEILQGGT